MAELTFSQYQSIMKPIEDLILGIVKIVGYENPEQEVEISNDLLTQITTSALVMHMSERELMNKLPETDLIEKMVDEKDGAALVGLFTKDVTPEKLFKFLQDSASIVMTNYYNQVKDKMTPEKTQAVAKLYQEIEEGINK